MFHHDIHDGTSELMLQIYKFNHVSFRANVLYPYQRRNLDTGIFEYRANSFMRFIPTDDNMKNVPYGENVPYILLFHNDSSWRVYTIIYTIN